MVAPGSLLEPIAIVGIGCRLPGGADAPASLWQLLCDRFDAIRTIPTERFDAEALYDPRPATPGRIMSTSGGFLDGVEDFDAGFFGISPREAERLDPQQRLLLETSFEALEDAGIPRELVAGTNTGVFVGIWIAELESRMYADPDHIDFYMTTGTGRYAASGRISYFLDLVGPSVTVDTACSSSLVAVHLGCQSLSSGECDLVLAGGANVILDPTITLAYSQSRMMAPDGRCKFGDGAADGYVRSDGAGVVALKRLSSAQAAGDHVYAVIRGSAVTNDGRSSGFLATPGQAGQEEMLRQAYARAGVDPATVQYVEAHGTGTAAGDPVELGALGAVLSVGRPVERPCLVGSIKSNVGHTEGAAGVSGLIKVALALDHGAVPPSLHVTEPNPNIPWTELGLRVCTEQHELSATGDAPVRAGVSAFGITGTNAHVVLEAAHSVDNVVDSMVEAQGPHLLALSAHDQAALQVLARRYAAMLGSTERSLTDVCAAAATKRGRFAHRLAVVASSTDDCVRSLEAFGRGDVDPTITTGVVAHDAGPSVAFVFPGQGSQWVGMARELLASAPAFREQMHRCDRAIRAEAGWSPIEILTRDDMAARLDDIDVIQPLLFAVQVSLAAQWRSWAVVPDAVVGHSMGEVAAAYVAGALSLEDATAVICRRSALLRRVRGLGAMLVVDLPMAEVRDAIVGREHEIAIAVSNSPRSTVISGDPDAIELMRAKFIADDVFCRPVKVDVGSHSPQMDPLLDDLLAALADVAPMGPTTPFHSTVDDAIADGPSLDAAYWARNLRQPVLFGNAVERLAANEATIFVEISPHPILLPAVQQVLQHGRHDGAIAVSMRRDEPEQATMLSGLATLFVNGLEPDWSRVVGTPSHRVELPTYPWQRERHWYEPSALANTQTRGRREDDLLGWRLPIGDGASVLVWENVVDQRDHPDLYALHVAGSRQMPPSVLVEMMRRGSAAVGHGGLLDVRFVRPIELADDPMRIQVVIDHADGPDGTVSVYSRVDDDWRRHATARLASVVHVELDRPSRLAPGDASQSIEGDDIVRALGAAGLRRVEALQAVTRVEITGDSISAEIAGGPHFADGSWLVEACLHSVLIAIGAGATDPIVAEPISIAAVTRLGDPTERMTCRAVLSPVDRARSLLRRADIELADASGNVILSIAGLEVRVPTVPNGLPDDWLYAIEWCRADQASHVEPSGEWLVVSDRAGHGNALVRELVASGARCVVIEPGASPSELADDRFVARADSVDDMRWVLDSAFDDPLAQPLNVVIMSALDAHAAFDSEGIAAGTIAVCTPIIAVTSAIRRSGRQARIRAVTQGVHRVVQADCGESVAQAAAWGLGRTIAEELPDLWSGLIDLDQTADPETSAGPLVAELMRFEGSRDTEVAVRGPERFVSRLVRRSTIGAAPLRLRSDSSCLVTGGFGSIGRRLASWLVAHGARRIVLIGRTVLPPRSVWAEVDPDSAVGRRVALVREIEQLGAAVHVAAVDVADADALRSFVDDFKAEGWPPIRSVFHAAAVFGGELVDELASTSLREQLLPKVIGAWTLADALPDLDHLVLFSSIASVVPMAGQGAYAAGNAFLDALAHRRDALGLPAVSVNWGFWEGSDELFAGEVGQRRELDGRGYKDIANALAEAHGMHGFPIDQGLDIMGRLMSTSATQTVVVPTDWIAFAAARSARPLALAAEMVAASAPGATDSAGADQPEHRSLAELIASSTVEDREDFVEAAVRRIVGTVLKVPESRLDPQQPFGSMGLDSLMGIELRNGLEAELGLTMSATVAWNYPSVRELSAYVLERMVPRESSMPASPATGPGDRSGGAEQAQVGAIVAGVAELSDDEALTALLSGGQQ